MSETQILSLWVCKSAVKLGEAATCNAEVLRRGASKRSVQTILSSSCLQSGSLAEDSALGAAREVALAEEAAIVHALGLVKGHANPLTGGEVHGADVGDSAGLATPAHALADGEGATGSCWGCWGGHRCWCCHRCGHGSRHRCWCCTSAELRSSAEDASLWGAREVLNAEDASIMHAVWLVKLNANPLAGSEAHLAHELDSA
mmetsp:Transcript_37381/g.87531  ORF Transcript_37381/g.87531 Transcript_37381/m.87531 type:complete len:202 (+) Transcript_37381:129-734(+)